jgi:serine/threonine-protein kinase HipA
MRENSLKIFINKTQNGILSYEDDKYIFNYDEDIKDVVSLTMPIRKQSWVDKNLHPIFQMNLPEGALKDAIKNSFAKITKMDDIGFLKIIGPYMLGRVKFNEIKDNKDNLNLENILRNTKENLFDELLDKYAIRSGISGVQPKVLLSAHNKTTMKFEHYIIKSWNNEYPQLALNEYFCMKAIQKSGLKTPEFYLSNDLSMFIIKRFDIKDDGSYLGFEDMCVLTGRGTDEKYEGSYEECTRVIKDIISPQGRREALKSFFKAIVMNHLLQNGDAHLKNYGILYDTNHTDAYLAPIYDVISTTVYIKNDIPALNLGNAKLWWKEKTYKLFAKQSCNLSNKEYQDILLQCTEAIIQTKKELNNFKTDSQNIKEFLVNLKNSWKENI